MGDWEDKTPKLDHEKAVSTYIAILQNHIDQTPSVDKINDLFLTNMELGAHEETQCFCYSASEKHKRLLVDTLLKVLQQLPSLSYTVTEDMYFTYRETTTEEDAKEHERQTASRLQDLYAYDSSRNTPKALVLKKR